jgi:hypothetical protein
MSVQTRDAAGELVGQLDLDQLALLAEFDGDADAIEKLLTALRHGLAVDYTGRPRRPRGHRCTGTPASACRRPRTGAA